VSNDIAGRCTPLLFIIAIIAFTPAFEAANSGIGPQFFVLLSDVNSIGSSSFFLSAGPEKELL
jgi:hypothetical protein